MEVRAGITEASREGAGGRPVDRRAGPGRGDGTGAAHGPSVGRDRPQWTPRAWGSGTQFGMQAGLGGGWLGWT